jgi:hypothetical protein
MHLSSLEVRWFWSDSVDKHSRLKATFQNIAPVVKRSDAGGVRWAKPREDIYIIIPSADDLGIKLREGELQTKGRRALLGNILMGENVYGLVEQWTKWSHEGPAVNEAFKPLFNSGKETKTVTTVWKQRALRKIRLDPMGEIQEVPENEHIDRGINCELTDLRVNGLCYCSLAFEAFPDDSEMPEQFTQVVTQFVKALDKEIFDGAVSGSYPSWLAKLIAEKGVG